MSNDRTKSLIRLGFTKAARINSIGFELNCNETQVIGAALMELAERTYCRTEGTTYTDFNLRSDTL